MRDRDVLSEALEHVHNACTKINLRMLPYKGSHISVERWLLDELLVAERELQIVGQRFLEKDAEHGET